MIFIGHLRMLNIPVFAEQEKERKRKQMETFVICFSPGFVFRLKGPTRFALQSNFILPLLMFKMVNMGTC